MKVRTQHDSEGPHNPCIFPCRHFVLTLSEPHADPALYPKQRRHIPICFLLSRRLNYLSLMKFFVEEHLYHAYNNPSTVLLPQGKSGKGSSGWHLWAAVHRS